MKKENFILLVLSVISSLVFSLGMCMALIEEWNMFNVGVGCGIVGFVGLLITYFVYRKMSKKKPIKLNIKAIAKTLYGIISLLVFGIGMCMIMVFEGMIISGIIIGLIGIVMLLGLIPMCIGLK